MSNETNTTTTDAQLPGHTRFRANIQLGDGPDQRGDVTVETVRSVDEVARRETAVETPDGEFTTQVSDEAFAEFYLELARGTDALRAQLGLDEGGEDE